MLKDNKFLARIPRFSIILFFIFAEFATTLALPAANASALNGSNFNAGHIIDDSTFTNSTAMSVSQIQQFLNAQVTCDTNGAINISYYFDSGTGEVNNRSDGTWVTTSRSTYGQRFASWWNSQPSSVQQANGYTTNESMAPYVCLQN